MTKKKFALVFDANMDVSKVKKSVSEIQSALNGLNLSKGMASSVSGTFKKLIDELDNYNNLVSQTATSMADIKKADKSLQTILDLFDKVNDIAGEVGKNPLSFIDASELKKINAAKKALESAKQAMSNTAVAAKKANLQDQFDKAKKKVDDLNDKIGQLNTSISSKKTTKSNLEASLEQAKQDLAELKKELTNLEANPVRLETKTTSKKGVKTTEVLNAQEVEDYKNKLNTTRQQVADAEAAITSLNRSLQATDTSKLESELEQVQQQARQATKDMQELGEKLKHVGKDNKAEAIKKLRDELADLTGSAKKDIPQTIDKIEEFVESLSEVQRAKVAEALQKMNAELAETAVEGKRAADGLERTVEKGESLSKAADDIEHLKGQILDFFSIGNVIQLFKNTIRDAIATVKELDAAMTETAVVTDFSISDMWEKLPEYSKQATKLGTSIKSLYEATTLYYQQGLKSEQAMGVGIETMKMARIANMDAAAATEAMTAALRGFNMEINELSATRINDVYSELAAVTAADTSQIATAMSKTASIAASANMEFETTAALLAQIIETTQEAPETAGTAMKTIIARFTEVKQLFSEGMLTGEDSEGEEININKIDAALKSVGISLKDFLTGSKGIDDIFLELASKWDGLDLATQRYIATAAAGSRQQSRFLAMMSNYDRTMELVNAATTSAGASQKQFGKTLDSLDAKLQRLKNSWDTFAMGLADSELIKGGVDILNYLLETINKITDSFGDIGGSVAKLTLGLTALKTGKGLFNLFLGKAYSEGESVGGKFAAGLVSSIKKIPMEEATENMKTNLKESLSGTTKLTNGLFALGMGLEFVANQLDGTPLEKYKSLISGVGTAILGVSGALKILTPIAGAANKSVLQLLGTIATAIGPVGVAVAAVVALGGALAYIAYQNSPEQVLKRTKERAEEAGAAAEEAAQQYAELKNSLDNLSSSEKALDELTTGTQEWRDAVVSLNEEVLSLIEKYPELEDLIDFKDGHLTINYESEKGQEILKQQHNQVVAKQNASVAANTAVAKQEINDYYHDNLYSFDSLFSREGLTEELAQAVFQNYSAFDTQEELVTWLKGNDPYASYGYHENTLNNILEHLSEYFEYGKFLQEKQNEYAAYDKITQSNIMSGMNLEQYGSQIVDLLGKVQTSTQENADSWLVGQDINDDNYKEKGSVLAEALYGEGAQINRDWFTGDITITDKSGNESREMSFDDFKNQVAYFEGTKQSAEQLEKAAETMSKMTDSQLSDLGQLLSAEGEGISASLLKDIGSDGIENYISSTFGKNVKNQFESIFGVSFATLKENLSIAMIRIIKEREKLIKKISKYSSEESDLYETNAQLLASLGEKFGEEIYDIFNNVLTSLENTGDEDLITRGIGEFKKAANAATSEADIKSLSSFIEKINWTNPIEAVSTLNKEIETGTELTKNYAQSLLDADSSFLSASSQIEYFTNSSEFLEEISQELDEVIEKNDKLTSSDVLELADKYKSLDKILKNTKLSANGLAFVLQSLQEGKLHVNQLTNSVLASLESFDSLGSLITETLNTLENFDPGVDENQFAEFMNTAYEKVKANIESGAVGNSQNFSYLDFLFPGWRESGKDLDYFVGQLGRNSSNMRASWLDLAKGKDVFGNEISTEGPVKVEQLEDGSISLTGFEGMTTDELVSWIAEAYNVSKDYAKMMLGDFKNYSEDLALELMANDYSVGIEKAYEDLNEVEGKKIVDKSEIAAMAKATGKNEDKIKDDLEAQEDGELIITDFYDENNQRRTSEEIYSQISEIVGDTLSSTFQDGVFDITTFTEQALEGFELSEQEKSEILQSFVDSLLSTNKTITISQTMGDGKTHEYEINQGEQLAGVTATQEELIDNEALASATVTAFAVEFDVIESKLDGIIQAVQNLDPQVIINNFTSEPKVQDKVNWKEADPNKVAERAYAGGIKKSPGSYRALVSEEGPELIQKADGGAYLTGQNGPEMAQIEKGDTVYTAEETKKILKERKHSVIPRYEGGGGKATAYGGVNSNNGGSGNGDDEADIWKNSIDKLYNLLREIDEELRQRERIERRYEKLLQSIDSSANKIINVSLEELDQLEEERKLQEQLIAGRKDQIAEYLKENSDLNTYANVTQNDRGEDVLRINWELIDAITDKDEGARVEEYLGQLEEWFSDLEGAEDALWEIEDAVDEIKQRGKEEYFELEETIKEAVLQTYQDQIDSLHQINDSINDTNSSLLDAIQTSIDKARQERDNARTEEELAEKQRRLLYLQQDTSGANATEILRLQDEIARGQEDYTDSLIDQKISELQDQNDKAAEQREQQISVLETQLEQLEKSGEIWNEVYALMDEGLDKDGGLIRGSQLETILQNSSNFSGLSTLGKMEWMNDTNSMIAQALAYLEVGRQLEDIGLSEGSSISFTTQDGKKLTGVVDKDGNVVASDGQIYDNVYQGADGSYYAGKNKEKAEEPAGPEQKPEPTTPPAPVHPNWTEDNIIGIAEAIWEYGRNTSGWGAGNERFRKIDEKIGAGASDEVQDRINQISANKVKTGYAKKKLSEYFYGRFKQGGLADFTGPAWLDGSKARPEIVLDAQDSRNFIQLRDILGSLLNRSVNNTSTENNGDITYDIDINVESIGSDYDVDQVANKIKSLINEDARYRNNNAVSLRR